MIKNTDIIKGAVKEAHNSREVMESYDFVSGAWHTVEFLKKKGLLKAETEGADIDVYQHLQRKVTNQPG